MANYMMKIEIPGQQAATASDQAIIDAMAAEIANFDVDDTKTVVTVTKKKVFIELEVVDTHTVATMRDFVDNLENDISPALFDTTGFLSTFKFTLNS